MLDQNLFINDYEETKRRLMRKKVSVDQIEEIRKAVLDRKNFVGEVDGLRAEINEKSKQVGILFQQGKKDDAEDLKSSVPKLKKNLDIKLQELNSKQIKDITLEMLKLIKDSWKIKNKKDLELQRKFKKLYLKKVKEFNFTHLQGKLVAIYSPYFLRKNQWFLK